MSYFLGIVVNPKTLAPCAMFRIRDRTITITDERLRIVGEGYFSGQDDGLEYKASEASGYPRFHCPVGVKGEYRKRGYGTALYAAGACAAYLEAEVFSGVLVGTTQEGPGLSSNNARSSEADKWWASALASGIAYHDYNLDVSEYMTEEEVEEEYEDDLTAKRGSLASRAVEAAQEWVEANYEGSVDVRDLIVRGTVTNTVQGGDDVSDEADVLPYEPASGALGVQNITLFATMEISHPYRTPGSSLEFEPNSSAEWNTTLAEVVNLKKVSAPMYRFLEQAYKEAGQSALFRELAASGAGDAPERVFGDDADFYVRSNPRRRRNPTDRRREEALAALNIQAYADIED